MKRNAIIVAMLVALVFFVHPSPFDTSQSPEHWGSMMQYIEGKLSPSQISDTLQPVLIFQYGDKDVVKDSWGHEEVHSSLVGSGSMFPGPDGNYRVITAEHLFSRHSELNYIRSMYAVKVLREKGRPVMRNIVKAGPLFLDKPGLVDVAVCLLGSDRGVKIQPFSPFQGREGKPDHSNIYSSCRGKPEDMIIRSLVSGEEATLLALDKTPGAGNVHYYIIDYQGFRGESGTGFVDRKGNLYVLAMLVVYGVANINAELKELGVISTDKKAFSVVVGAFVPKTR